ncbi:endonuclease III [Noviherbaspirillum sp. L7-7A]|uniref:endonuclease III domain-containing protein n=1 Tax=Noviherbaspirillum sp. L7-7A TaxID=2850560 RepID=UPI001C2CB75F|nr:endonuclease III [Noviherbaspirillum sp. L7-7A]MBV0881438.1 endonuclease III [Noviherbaspirillum sp. L7-7A]
MEKRPFDIGLALERIREAVRPWPKAALFQLAEEGYRSTFEQLLACIISIRTYDEVTLPVSRKLFERARTPEEVARLKYEEVDALISPSTFHERKASQMLAIAQQVAEEFGGLLPGDRAVLLSFAGVGPKCANLVLGIACGTPFISVDVHVHRVSARWGYISAATPEKALLALEATLPQQHWIEINELLVPFGKHVCTGKLPHCSTCPVHDMCQQVGVTAHR